MQYGILKPSNASRRSDGSFPAEGSIRYGNLIIPHSDYLTDINRNEVNR